MLANGVSSHHTSDENVTDESDCGDETSYLNGRKWSNLSLNEYDDDDDTQYCSMFDYSGSTNPERLQELEFEQEQLNQSLLALTTHFAQVQFRLKQIVDASAEEKEVLLKDLEEFAFRGIPDVRDIKCKSSEIEESLEDLSVAAATQSHEQKLSDQKQKQQELIIKLKDQLDDLEQYAYQTGEAGLPQNMVMEKQKVIIDQLKGKLNLDLKGFDKLTIDELKTQVDNAIGQLVNPAKMKEQLVSQLKTQIIDLERFIVFLQGEVGKDDIDSSCTCNCPVHTKDLHFGGRTDLSDRGANCCSPTKNHRHRRLKHSQHKHMENQRMKATTTAVMKRALAVLQMFALSHLGCGSQSFHHNILKKTSKGNHWGDLRAKLEIAIQNVIEIVSQEQPVDSDYTSDSEDSPIVMCNEKLTTSIRKDLAMAIKGLMEHGLMPMGQSRSLVPIGCFPVRSTSATPMMHPWQLLLQYYKQKQGDKYNATPARKLSQSFNLDIIGGSAVTPKQTLLGVMNAVISTHTPLKRSDDSHFKAFISAAINEKKLVTWLKLLFRSRSVVEDYYQPWSYVAKTGFEDSLKSLEKLNQYNFDLPVNLAVRQFQNIQDAF